METVYKKRITPIAETEAYNEMRTKQQSREKQDFQDCAKFVKITPLQALLVYKESVLEIIIPEYLWMISLNLFITFVIKLPVVENTRIFHFVISLTQLIEKFPSGTVIFLLGMCAGNIRQVRDNLRTSIPFTDKVTYLIKSKIAKKEKQHKVARLIYQMGIESCSHIEKRVSLEIFRGRFGDDFMTRAELNAYKSQGKQNSMIRNPYYFTELIRTVSGEESWKEIETGVMEYVEKCNTMYMFNYIRPSFQTVSTLVMTCLMYLFHLFLDLLPMTSSEDYFSDLFAFSFYFIIFYGYLKISVFEYNAFGGTKLNYKLYNIWVRNIVVSEGILAL